MAHQSPFTKEISDEWHRLVFEIEPRRSAEREPKAEQVEGWRRLYARTVEEGRWLVSADDAGLVASLGITIALRQRRFADAAQLAYGFLEHPGAAEGDKVTWATMSIRHGIALILSDRMEEGIGQLQNILNDRRYVRPKPESMIRPELLMLLDELGSDSPVDARLARFASKLFAVLPGHERKAKEAIVCASYGDLARLLEATFPRTKSRTS